MTTLYRATSTGYQGRWSCWTPERETAAAYQLAGVGHGGASIVSMEVPGGARVLDCRGRNGSTDWSILAEACRARDPQEMARRWSESGWLYPHEESTQVSERLLRAGYDWLVYHDDYPEGAVTYVRLTEAE